MKWLTLSFDELFSLSSRKNFSQSKQERKGKKKSIEISWMKCRPDVGGEKGRKFKRSRKNVFFSAPIISRASCDFFYFSSSSPKIVILMNAVLFVTSKTENFISFEDAQKHREKIGETSQFSYCIFLVSFRHVSTQRKHKMRHFFSRCFLSGVEKIRSK